MAAGNRMATFLLGLIVGVTLLPLVRWFRDPERPRRLRSIPPATVLASPVLSEPSPSPASPARPAPAASATPSSPPPPVEVLLPQVEIPPELVREGDRLEAAYHRKRFAVVRPPR